MFTGLVQALGTVASLEATDAGARIAITAPGIADGLSQGDSVAVNGVCLTAVEITGEGFFADAVTETLRRSSLGALATGEPVNLELALRVGDRMGGHLVQGHVDTLGTVDAVSAEGESHRLRVAVPPEALRYVVEKGSIAIDGVSLTVAEVDAGGFAVALIPETLDRTTLGRLSTGRVVNLEVDVIAKYVEKLAVPVLERL